jgi:hypothetical protein
LSERKLLADQAQSKAAFALAKFPLDGVASPLIIYELPLLVGHQIWITFGPTKSRTTLPDLMTCTECTITACPINLIGANNGRIMPMTPAISSYLSLQIFSFVIWIETQPIEEGKSISRDRDGYFGTKFNIAAGLAPYDRSDVGLHQANDPLGDASAVRMIEDSLLTH